MSLWMPGVPVLPCPNPGGPIALGAAVVHKTIGVWPGDRDYVQAKSLAHFTIGPDQGDWAQHASCDVFLPHANGANSRAFGIEFSDLDPNGPLTPWQADAWTQVRAWAVSFGVPDTYLDPDSQPFASVHVNTCGYMGWISHYSVQTDDGSTQHTDSVPYSSFTTIAGDDFDMPFSTWPLEEKLGFAGFIKDQVNAVLNDESYSQGFDSVQHALRYTIDRVREGGGIDQKIDAIAKKGGGGTVDYAAIAKAVNDDAAQRLAK